MRKGRERRDAMLEAIAAGDKDIRQLAERFCVSLSTVRRDPQRPSHETAVPRTYGGAMVTRALR